MIPDKENRTPDKGWARDIGWASTVGLTLVFSTVVGLALGVVLDRWLHAKPFFTLLLLILGIVAGFWNIFKGIRK